MPLQDLTWGNKAPEIKIIQLNNCIAVFQNISKIFIHIFSFFQDFAPLWLKLIGI